MRNVEIKARVDDIEATEAKAAEISDRELCVIKQCDTFFRVPAEQQALGGRLKLREFQDGQGELIYYSRPNVQGPKLSTYSKVDLDAQMCKELKLLLTESNGVLGTVKKTRHLYMFGQVRIHIDRVANLGNFMEFEVVLKDSETVEDGQKLANALMEKFNITENMLLSEAYMDMILKR